MYLSSERDMKILFHPSKSIENSQQLSSCRLYGTRSGSSAVFICRSVPSSLYMPLASLVPDFPRLLDRPQQLPPQMKEAPLPGTFDVNAEARLMFPDLVTIDNLYTGAIILSFIVVFISFEGVELLREIQDEQTFEKLVEKKGFVSKKKKKEEDTIEEMRQQRRRGLGWLAVVTGIAVWATGLVNSLNPL